MLGRVTPAATSAGRQSKLGAVMRVAVGNALEMYDFQIFEIGRAHV